MVKKSNFSVFSIFCRILLDIRLKNKILEKNRKIRLFDHIFFYSQNHEFLSNFNAYTLHFLHFFRTFSIYEKFLDTLSVYHIFPNISEHLQLKLSCENLKFRKNFFKITKCYIYQQALVVEHFNVQKWKIETLGLRLMCQT